MSDWRFSPFAALTEGSCYDCDQPIVPGHLIRTVPGSYHGCGTRPAWAYRHDDCKHPRTALPVAAASPTT